MTSYHGAPGVGGWNPQVPTTQVPTTQVPTPPVPVSTLPTRPVRYPAFWRTDAWSPWKPIVALLIAGVVFFILQVMAFVVAMTIDVATGRIDLNGYLERIRLGKVEITPTFFLANNVALGLSIPLAFLLSRWPFGQPGGFVSSVIGRLRWRLLLTYMAAISLPWLVVMALSLWSGRGALQINADTWVLAVGILLTTPFQAAGEEYLFRGIGYRAFASFFRNPAIAIPFGGVLQALLFMSAHGAGDATLNAHYLLFGLIAAWLVWRTGGLEAAIAVHVVNNLTSEAAMPFTDISQMFDRQEGVASLADVWPIAVCLLIAVVLAEVFVRRSKPRVLGPMSAGASSA